MAYHSNKTFRRSGRPERWRLTAWLTAVVLGGLAMPAGRLAELPRVAHRFVVIAHRGNHAHAHENTLAAIEAAVRVGADYVELDVRQTRDGRLVLMHNSTVDHTTDGHGAVNDLTLAVVRKLHVVDSDRPELSPARVPTFDEALTAMTGRIHLYLDFKAGDRRRTVAALRRHAMLDQTIVYDAPEAFGHWRAMAPDLPLMCSLPREARTAPEVRAFLRCYRPAVLDGAVDDYAPSLVRAVRETGIPVWPDIQAPDEQPARWAAACALGVTGLQTDHPAGLIRWLETTGRR